MSDKPSRANGYDLNRTELIRRACLEVATRLGDLRSDVCIVGGMVPSLLVDMSRLPSGVEPHVGTNDLDLGLSIAILDEQRYQEIARRFRQAGFRQDISASGKPTLQRWQLGAGVLVDFLITPSTAQDKGGSLRHLESDFAAIITPGLHLAFRDHEAIDLQGEALSGGTAVRGVVVCGPGAFLVLKSLAFRNRGENKDAYDLWYVLANRPDSSQRLRSLMRDEQTKVALQILRQDFADAGNIGPRRAAEFLFGTADENFQADFAGLVRVLMREVQD